MACHVRGLADLRIAGARAGGVHGRFTLEAFGGPLEMRQDVQPGECVRGIGGRRMEAVDLP